MKNNIFFFLSIICVSFLISSCSTSKGYGDRSDKYSRGRIKNNRQDTYSKEDKEVYSTEKNKTSNDKTTGKYKVFKSEKVSAEDMKRNELTSNAQKYIGIPYKYAGKSPKEGFDCSGFTNYVYNENGFSVKGPSYDLAMLGQYRSKEQLKPGDLVFFGADNKISHVGMVMDNTIEKIHFIHSSTSAGVKVDEINESDYWKNKYLFGRDLLSQLLKDL
jgi:cell wall-associated NlpC family hydrolase